ncbi:hypothetical protein EDC01DRAFT_636779 [Geopyxis carbonaria]|nr:hypothetical protein EDC01DRAFT_636779 [Geopyxis carbonaria]
MSFLLQRLRLLFGAQRQTLFLPLHARALSYNWRGSVPRTESAIKACAAIAAKTHPGGAKFDQVTLRHVSPRDMRMLCGRYVDLWTRRHCRGGPHKSGSERRRHLTMNFHKKAHGCFTPAHVVLRDQPGTFEVLGVKWFEEMAVGEKRKRKKKAKLDAGLLGISGW